MAGLFNRNLPAHSLSSGFAGEYGYNNETFDFPSSVAIDEVSYPVGPGTDGTPSGAPDITSGDAFQATGNQPDYAGFYDLGYRSDPGMVPSYAEQNPAPGSASLIAPRDAAGVAGTNRVISSRGPVSGQNAEVWSGLRDGAYTQEVGLYGPVAGGEDYHSQLQQAYWQAHNANVDYAAAEAGMVAAV